MPTDGAEVAHWMVAKGFGVSVLPEGQIVPYEAALGIRAVALTDSWADRQLLSLRARLTNSTSRPASDVRSAHAPTLVTPLKHRGLLPLDMFRAAAEPSGSKLTSSGALAIGEWCHRQEVLPSRER
jgi:hypothetical protein